LDGIEDSLDYDIYVWYYYFLESINEKIPEIKQEFSLGEKYMWGFIKELLFTDWIFDNDSCEKELDFDFRNTVIKDYSLIYGMNTQLSYYVYGKMNKDIEQNKVFLNFFKPILSEIIQQTDRNYYNKIRIEKLISLSEKLQVNLSTKIKKLNEVESPPISSGFSTPFNPRKRPLDSNISPPEKNLKLPLPPPNGGGRSRKIKRKTRKTKKTNQKNKKKKRTTRKKNK
jgi:hypothetical protein